MKTNHLRALIEIADAGSLRGAARSLGQSQPALSKNLAALEADLQVALVQRTARGVRLTAYGQTLVTRARRVESELRHAREEIDAMRTGAQTGEVAIAVSPAAALGLVPPALNAFRQRYPRVVVRIVDGMVPRVLPLLREGKVDLVLGPLPPRTGSSDLRRERLLENDVCVVARKRHPLAEARTIGELADAQWANWGPPEGAGGLIAKLFATRRLPPPHFGVTTESFLALQALLAQTDLLSVMPATVLAAHPQALIALPLKDRVPSISVGIVTRADTELTAIARAFAEALRAAASRIVRS